MAVTKIRILLNGVPLEGASIVLGDIGELQKVSDSDGGVAFPNIEPPFVGFVEAYITSAGVVATSKVLITAGQTSDINLGTISLE